jgi:hypothetical protein
MDRITYHGKVFIPQSVTDHADKIKLENYKVNKPKSRDFKIRHLEGCDDLMEQLAEIAKVPRGRLDYVYFSCCKGAEPHEDNLNPDKFEDTTYVVPVIVPKGKSVIEADGKEMEVTLGGVYQFDHTKTHSMYLEDTESGCVVIMVAVLKV